MKSRTMYPLLFLAVLFLAAPSFGQSLDVAFEGPWLFYVEPSFSNGATTSPVLVAFAPQVAGHIFPTFSTGDGTAIRNFGIFCVTFDDVCKPNSITTLNKDGYAPALPVKASKPAGWTWTSYASSAYVFILPMPDSYSNDGVYPTTFQSSFPTSSSPPSTYNPTSQSIGLIFHYTNGPKQVGLMACTGTPSVSTCNTLATTDQDNSGTLRITIKSDENPANPATCDYHAHRAYHRMLQLLDPFNTNNKNIAYVDLPKYDSCTQCDPQQDLVPSDCAATHMMESTVYEPADLDVPASLQTLVTLLQNTGVRDDQKKSILLTLPTKSDQLKGKFATLNQLKALKEELENSATQINKLLKQLKTEASPKWIVGRDLETALTVEQSLIKAAISQAALSISGKDCRALVMLVQ